MAAKRKPIQISPESELGLVLKRAATDGEPVLVDTGDELLEIDVQRSPDSPMPAKSKPSPEQVARTIAGIRRSAGGWKGLVDADEFTSYIYERRRMSGRPPVNL